MNGKRLGILALLFATLTIISCGGGGGGGGSSATPTTTGASDPALVGTWHAENNDGSLAEELTFDNTTATIKAYANGSIYGDYSAPYSVSGNSITFDASKAIKRTMPSGSSAILDSINYSVNGNILTLSNYHFTDGYSISSPRDYTRR